MASRTRILARRPPAPPGPDATIGERAWWAYQCLPRQGKDPPSVNSLEAIAKIGKGTLHKLLRGERDDITAKTLTGVTTALRVSKEWLLFGSGDPPRLTGPYELPPWEDPDEQVLQQEPTPLPESAYRLIPDIEYPNRARAILAAKLLQVDDRAIDVVNSQRPRTDHSPKWWYAMIEHAEQQLEDVPSEAIPSIKTPSVKSA